uniref:Uncharacterized protein n=1 Tax=Astyanax mexicanus TaxID=7994 RepID=A0A3B1J496_ASTMX
LDTSQRLAVLHPVSSELTTPYNEIGCTKCRSFVQPNNEEDGVHQPLDSKQWGITMLWNPLIPT